MARLIAETPVLTGQDARRFREAMENITPISPDIRARIEANYQLAKQRAKGIILP
jgi:hypothetical protein